MGGDANRILTPDQRLRVFISSTLVELAEERAAAREAVEGLRLIPVMFELGARPHPARALYRAYLQQSHVFVGVYHERYGWVAPGEAVSGLEDEYHLSGPLPRLVYLKAPAPGREPRLDELLGVIKDDDTAAYKTFSSPEQLADLLRDDLVVMLAERFLTEPGAAGPDGAELSASVHALPRVPRPVSSLVGRDADVARVEEVLGSGARLVTVVGAGGIGKTRVGLEVARRAAEQHPEGVVFVPLETVDDPADVLPAVAARLGLGGDGGVPVADALSAAFGDRPFLLVLDNVEQVAASAADVADLLERCPGVAVVATSRSALRVRGEHLVQLGPLGLTVEEGSPAGEVPASVQLFVERARAVSPDFRLDDPADAAAVAELCRRLDGIPLALEIAAARVRLVRPRGLLDQIGTALDLGSGAVDAPARQRTLRDTLAWSAQLLTPGQLELLARLSVFAAPWTVADAAAVAGPSTTDVFDDVAGLVENSLVSAGTDAPGEPRLSTLRTVRAYADELLDRDARASAQAAFVTRMAAQVEHLSVAVRSPESPQWSAEVALLWPDIRHAWELALKADDVAAVGSLSQVVLSLWIAGRRTEAAALVEETIALAHRTPSGPERLPLVLAAAMWLSNAGDFDRADPLLEVLHAELPRVDDGAPGADVREAVGWVALLRGYAAAERGDVAECERELQRSVDTLRAAGTVGAGWFEAFARSGLGGVAMGRGDVAGAEAHFAACRRLGRECGNSAARMQGLVFTAALRLDAGDHAQARELLVEACGLVEQEPYYEGNGYFLETVAAYALSQGRPEEAALSLGRAAGLRDVAGAPLWELAAEGSRRTNEAVRTALGDGPFAAAYDAGRATDPRAAADMTRVLLASA